MLKSHLAELIGNKKVRAHRLHPLPPIMPKVENKTKAVEVVGFYHYSGEKQL